MSTAPAPIPAAVTAAPAAPKGWYSIRAAANKPKSAEISIYDEIGGWGMSARAFVAELNRLQVDEITLRIHSPGGSVLEGNAIFNALQRHKATVHVAIDGMAASMASVIAMAGDTVEIAENGILMIHNPFVVAVGDSGDLRQSADVLDKLKDGIVTAYERKTGMDRAALSALMDAETWMTAEEALSMGFVDFVGGRIEAKASFDLSRFHASAVDSRAPGSMKLKDLIARLGGTKPAAPLATEPAPATEPGAAPATGEAPSGQETPAVEEETPAGEQPPSPERADADAEPVAPPVADPAARAAAPDLSAALATLRTEMEGLRAQITTLAGERDAARARTRELEGEVRDAEVLATQLIGQMPIEQPIPRGATGSEVPPAAKTADEIKAEYRAIEDREERHAFFQKHKDVLMN